MRTDGYLVRARGEVRQYRASVYDEPWKAEHEAAKKLFSFEERLAFGVGLFQYLIQIDETWRCRVMNRECEYDQRVDTLLGKLFKWWASPRNKIERHIRKYEDLGYEVAHASEFRKCCAEAEWMITSPEKLFDRPEFVQLRDEAIDSFQQEEASGGGE